MAKPTKKVSDLFEVTAVRPTIWEEHCLECSAPQCFSSCSHYEARVDGRCKRFDNGIEVFASPEDSPDGCAARVRFRPWGNLLTIVYPGFSPSGKIKPSIGHKFSDTLLRLVSGTRLPARIMWPVIRIVEYARRYILRKKNKGSVQGSDAFVLHACSHHPEPFNLILEVYQENSSVFRTSFKMSPGENLHLLESVNYSDVCDAPDNTIKIYPENDIPADIVFYWCHFVQGQAVNTGKVPDKYVKCLVWDLDHTLWDGILIESDDPDTLQLKDGVLETVQELDRRGILQSVASKNDHEPAMTQLKRLALDDYFLYPQINWEPKSQSLSRIAEALNINIDSFAFIDDSVFEREQVTSQFPQVRIYDETMAGSLQELEPFSVEITSASGTRRATYKAELERKEFRETQALDLSAFIRECEIKITVFTPSTPSEIDRCFELVQRTNQLNISGKKYSRSEFEELLDSNDRKTVAFSCADKFGEYGIVCFAQFQVLDRRLEFLEFAMSCRVAGKHIENAFLNYIKKSTEAEQFLFPVKKTPKNGLMRKTLAGIGLPAIEDDDERIVFDFTNEIINANDVQVVTSGTCESKCNEFSF